MKKYMSLMLIVASLIILGISSNLWADTLDKIRKEGYIRVGFANEVPYSYADSSGKLTGESPTVFKYTMEKLGIKEVDGVLTEWGSLIPGLKSGRFDAIVASMYITPQRCKEIIFSNPTYGIGDALVMLSGAKSYANLDDAVRKGAKISFVSGTAQVDHARWLNIDKNKLMIVPDFNAQTASIKGRRANAAVMTDLTAKDVVEKVSGLKRIPYVFKYEGKTYMGQGGFGFRKEDNKLRNAVNKILDRYLGSKDHLKAVSEFGFGKSNLPENTEAELCSDN